MAIVGDTLPHCSGTGTQADPYIFTTVDGFKEAIAVEQCYMEAGQSNLIFDCNVEDLAPPLTFKYAYFDAKGLTILNFLANRLSQPMITFSGIYTRTTLNLNFYNFCIITYDNRSKSEFIYFEYQAYNAGLTGKANFTNCNFAGQRIGSGQGTMFGKSNWTNSSDYEILEGVFTNCTFNIHFDDPTRSTNGSIRIFCGNQRRKLRLVNCSVYLSGWVNYAEITGCGSEGQNNRIYTYLDTVTFVNLESNPLTCNYLRIDPAVGGYNYFKLYVTLTSTTKTTKILDSLMLINSSRITPTDPTKLVLSGIVMQEDDSTAADYIYNETNLENAGFLVGRVIS